MSKAVKEKKNKGESWLKYLRGEKVIKQHSQYVELTPIILILCQRAYIVLLGISLCSIPKKEGSMAEPKTEIEKMTHR